MLKDFKHLTSLIKILFSHIRSCKVQVLCDEVADLAERGDNLGFPKFMFRLKPIHDTQCLHGMNAVPIYNKVLI